MTDMNEFLELAHRAGIGTLNSLAIAEALEISTSYVAKLRSGSDPLRPRVRAKLVALIAAKANGPEPVESKHVLEHGEIRERVEQVEVDLPATDKPVDRGLYVEITPLIELKHRLRGMIESAVQIHPGSDHMVVDRFAVRAVYDRLREILPNKEAD